jgi:hypothetical protein
MPGILGHRERFFASMKSNSRLRSACALALAIAGACVSAPGVADELRNHFDTDAIMRPPGFFDPVLLGEPGGEARWLILVDTNPPSAPNKLVQVNSKRLAGAIAAALRRNVGFQDGSVSVFLKQGPGRAGLVLRLVDKDNFLLLLADTQSGDVVLTSYRDGKPTELGRGQRAFERGWEKIGATLAGPSVSVTFNDQKLFEAADPKPGSGRIGAATAGPGEASFDELLIVH